MQIQRSLASLTAIFVPAIASLLLFASCVASAANPGPHAQQDDPNATPTGGVRRIQYRLEAGEAGWVLRVDAMYDE